MTIMTSGPSIVPTDLFGNDVTFSKEELQRHVDTGVISRIDNHKEHYAIQPCWLHDPGSGVMAEINGYVLGRWNAKLKSYIVHVDNVRNNDRSAAMNEDHRWLHLDIFATFYTYTPEVGQRLKGEVKKIAKKAAICMIFDVFMATVFPNDESELGSWTVGDELQFEINSFTNRRKGPIIRATSISPRKDKSKGKKRKFFDLQESIKEEPQDEEVLENGYDPDETVPIHEISISKKKKHKKRRENPDTESFEEVGESLNVSSEYETVRTDTEGYHEESQELHKSKKKKKKKKSSRNEDD